MPRTTTYCPARARRLRPVLGRARPPEPARPRGPSRAHQRQERTDHMAEITAAAVKDLRERTGAGFMDCKNALVESGGDVEKAVALLREKGLAAAAKKAGREAREGLV